MIEKIIIVGAGHAGGRLAEYLAQKQDRFDVTLIGEESFQPYERPPLSKSVLLGTSSLEDCLIWKKGDTGGKIDVRLGVSVLHIDRDAKTVRLSDDSDLNYDRLVLATGSEVRQFSVPGDHFEGVMSLRSFSDSVAVSERFLASEKMIVVGGGFIGLEVASIAAQRGLSPSVIEASSRPLGRLVPQAISERIADAHRNANVELIFGAMVQRFVSNGRGKIKRAILSNGETVECDLAVVAVGVKPVVRLAEEAGLKVDVGVSTDERLQTSDPNIFACGDIASFWHPLYKQSIRLESWQNAEDHAKILAAVLSDEDVPKPSVPFFWSDQYERSLQILGLPHLGSSIRVKMATENSTILLHYDARDRIVGATAFGTIEEIGRELRQTRHLIASMSVYIAADFSDQELEILSS